MTTRYVALLRGINVGGNTKVPMAALRAIFEEHYSDVATLLNSGNVVFSASGAVDVAALRRRVKQETGVDTHMMVIAASEFRAIAKAMPFEGDGSKLLVTFMPSVPKGIEVPELEGEQIQIGPDATYQSLPGGILSTKLKPAFWRQFPPEQTGRNWNTVQKILDAL
jgi:uncharacterized protein (DUF1697 family)